VIAQNGVENPQKSAQNHADFGELNRVFTFSCKNANKLKVRAAAVPDEFESPRKQGSKAAHVLGLFHVKQ
jgi:hypothetical protein